MRKKIFSKIFLPYFFISVLDIAIRDMIKGEVSLQNLWVFHNWYVEFTIFVYVSFYFVWKYCKTTKHRIVGMAGASCLYVAFCLWSGLASTWYQGMWVLWFGMLIPLLDENLANNFIAKHRVLLLGMSILMMCLMNFLTFGVIHFPLSGTIGAEGVCLFTVTSMILIMPLFSGRGKIFRDFLEYLGENSYYCYLLHIPVCIILALWIENAWLQYLFTMVGTVGIIVCINRVKKLRVRRTK